MRAKWSWLACGFTACAAALAGGGCYEDQSPSSTDTQSSKVQEGPITSFGSQGGGPALGPAKRSAENLVRQAEDASRRTAEEYGGGAGE